MSPMANTGSSKRTQSLGNSRNPYETESPFSAPVRRNTTSSLPKLRAHEISHKVAKGFGDALGDMAVKVVDELTGFDRDANSSLDRGGVRIPTMIEYQAEQRKQHQRFFEEQKRAAEMVSKQKEEKDSQQINEINEMLRKEIIKYEKARKQVDENLDKVKKMLLLERQHLRSSVYQMTYTELAALIFKNLFIDASESNMWLEALMSKKKKRGSLFATRSKQQGTQYSLSQEMSTARSVQ